MAKTIRIPDGFITLVDVDFRCPSCNQEHNEDDYYKKLSESSNGHIYKKCKGCKETIGITTDMKGDVKVWLKSQEDKSGFIKIQ